MRTATRGEQQRTAEVLQSLSTKVDVLILGGGIANTILAATGVSVGKSLYEPDQVPFAKRLLAGETVHHRSATLRGRPG